MNLTLHGQRIFRVGAGHSVRNVDTVAGLDVAYPFANSFDDAGTVGTWGVWQWRLDGIGAVAHIRVVRVHSSRVDSNQNLSGAGTRYRDFFEPQDFGTAEFMNNDGLHCGLQNS